MNKQGNGLCEHIHSTLHVSSYVKYSARVGEMSNRELQGRHQLAFDSDFQSFRT